MYKMGPHDLFGHLKHKLWPKEKSGIKLTIWLLTIKSQESTRFPCVHMTWKILLENFGWGLQLFFKPHLNGSDAHKVMGPQSHGNPNFGKIQNVIWMWALWRGTKYTIKGKMVASRKSEPWWVLWVQVCPWLVLAPKVLQLCTNQLVIWFCACSCEWLSVYHSS
jgi:hypothetical protein